jgi:hypothetical protein
LEEREGGKKKGPPHSTLKRIKILFNLKTMKEEREEPKNYIFVGRGGEVDIVLMQLPWPKIPDFWDHPAPRIQCNQSSKEAGENRTREDIFEGICQRVEDSPMNGINVKNILQRNIHGLVHVKLARWPWNPIVDFERRAIRGRKCSTRWRAFSPSHCTSSSTTAVHCCRPPRLSIVAIRHGRMQAP